LFDKEGPLEHASHAVLAFVVLSWWRRGRRSAPARGGAAFWALVLAEELDWGAVLGIPLSPFERQNLHNALQGAAYMVFGAAVLAWFGLPRIPMARGVQWSGHPDAPPPWASWVVLALAPVGVVNNILWPELAPNLQELEELVLYTVAAILGARWWRGDPTRAA
jgi:hypothetical protein